jgi:hypothetical protein
MYSFSFMNAHPLSRKKNLTSDPAVANNVNILEPVLGQPSEKESKTTVIPKIW